MADFTGLDQRITYDCIVLSQFNLDSKVLFVAQQPYDGAFQLPTGVVRNQTIQNITLESGDINLSLLSYFLIPQDWNFNHFGLVALGFPQELGTFQPKIIPRHGISLHLSTNDHSSTWHLSPARWSFFIIYLLDSNVWNRFDSFLMHLSTMPSQSSSELGLLSCPILLE